MSISKIIRSGKEFSFKSFLFPGGEVGFKIDTNSTAYHAKTCQFAPADSQLIITRIQNSNDFIELAMAVGALREIDDTPIKVFIPYFPYARQDRVCDAGEAFSLQVFANLINALNLSQVIVCDPHSEVMKPCVSNLKVISQFDIINKYSPFLKRVGESNTVFISPDSGSSKKTGILAHFFDKNDFVRSEKIRDLSTGNIKELVVHCNDFQGADVICADDIVDGARTFIELAKICKARNCNKFILYATHSIFSKGIRLLFENQIDEIWTTNSFKWQINSLDKKELFYSERINVLNLENIINQ